MEHLRRRQEQIWDAMETRGIDKAVIGEPVCINYLTGVHVEPYERFYGLVMDASARNCTMIVPGLDQGCMKGTISELVYLDSDGPLESLKLSALCDKLAVDTKFFSMHTGEMFRDLNTDIVPLGDLIDRARMKKDEAEIELMRRAAEIVDEAVNHVKPLIKPGMTEKELNFLLYSYMVNIPGFVTSEVHILVQGGPNTAYPHGVSGEYAFQEGDVILMDFCAYYKHYWSDMTRCVFLGQPGEEKLAEIYDIVRAANEAAISIVKPGVKACEVDAAARNHIEKHGYGEYFTHRTGHGLGLSVHEEPYITSVNELVLEEGMTFTIEPGIYIEGLGGIRVEDDILVTRDGCEVLTPTSKKLEMHILSIDK